MLDIGVAILTTDSKPVLRRVVVLEGLSTGDRPLAIGYAIMDLMRKAFFMKMKNLPEVSVRLGTVSASDLSAKEQLGLDVYTPALRRDEFGDVYRLVAAVENGDRRLLDS